MPTIAQIIAAKLEKSTAAPSLGKRKAPGLVLGQTEPEATPLPPQEPRMLGARVGEALTVVPLNATPEMQAWDNVLNSWDTDLVIMEDPQPGSEAAWIALRPINGGQPVLLHRLAYWPHPHTPKADNQPF